jgi:hypothetical protein
MTETHTPMFLLPDPLLTPSMLSGAVMLYFKGPFCTTAPPAVITPESLALLHLVSPRNPIWAESIHRIVDSLQAVNVAAVKTWDSIKAIVPDMFSMVYPVFPADRAAYARVDEWVAAAGYEYRELMDAAIAPLGAAELARHIFLEMYLELDCDIEALYRYCDYILVPSSLDSLVVASYLLRLHILLSSPRDAPLLLTNEALAPLIEKLSAQASPTHEGATAERKVGADVVDADVVAWEFFRVLVSRIVDPLDVKRLRLIARVRERHHDQTQRLRARCRELADELAEQPSIVGLGDRALVIIETKLRHDLRDIFELDEKSWRDYKTSLASDKSVWISIASMLSGFAGSGPFFTAAGVITALATVGSTAVKIRAAREEVLRRSDLALLHILKR